MKDIRKALEQLKNITSVDEKATQLRTLMLSHTELEFAEEIVDSMVRIDYVKCEVNNAISTYGNLEPLGNLISGITNWSSKHFYVNGYGNLEDLTDEKVNDIIDEILLNLPEEVDACSDNHDWMVINDNGDLECKCVSKQLAEEIAEQKMKEEPNANWVAERMV